MDCGGGGAECPRVSRFRGYDRGGLATEARDFIGVFASDSECGRTSAGGADAARFLRTITVGFFGRTDFDGMVISLSIQRVEDGNAVPSLSFRNTRSVGLKPDSVVTSD